MIYHDRSIYISPFLDDVKHWIFEIPQPNIPKPPKPNELTVGFTILPLTSSRSTNKNTTGSVWSNEWERWAMVNIQKTMENHNV